MKDKTIDELQDLIRINIDSSKGFEEAADTIDSQPIAQRFRSIADQRRRQSHELRRIVSLTDEEAEDSGSIKGAVHRWWVGVRGTLNGGNDHVVLVEAERGEDAIKHRYEEAIGKVDDPVVSGVLKNQYAEVKRGHDAVRDLRDLAAAR